MNDYIFKKAENEAELQELVILFNQVFYPEKVGELAKVLTHHFPNMSYKNWYIAQDNLSTKIVSGFALIPWKWQMQGIPLKVAEMGIVGTAEQHRNKGLFKRCNTLFQEELMSQEFDLSVIQGIPGIYHRLGYHYALPLEHHTELPLYAICNKERSLNFRLANEGDLAFLLNEDDTHYKTYAIGSKRSKAQWEYILNESNQTEYASDLYIIETPKKAYYLRLLNEGFGQGLIVSEASCNMPHKVLEESLLFLKQEATVKERPYIRLNLPDSHCLVQHALDYEARLKPAYGWQVKIIEPVRFMRKIGSLLVQRVQNSKFKGLTAIITLDLYTSQLNLEFTDGQLVNVNDEKRETSDYMMSIPDDLLAALVLGHRTWRELQYNRPDIFPGDQYLRMDVARPAEISGVLIDVIFPKLDSWVYCQY